MAQQERQRIRQSMRSILIFIIFFFIILNISLAGNPDRKPAYRVFFTDKKDVNFDPYEYFDEKAIARRIKSNLPIYDETDKPVNSDYLNEIIKIADSIGIVSRWFNFAVVYADIDEIQKISNLAFVKKTEAIPVFNTRLIQKVEIEQTNSPLSSEDFALLEFQTGRMQGEYFVNFGLDGRTIRIAVFDAGFKGAEENRFLQHIFREGRIFNTYDFYRGHRDVFRHSTHGTMVLACIAGKNEDTIIGLATAAEFLLARTEHIIFEHFAEEEYWLAAAEWADMQGADIINSSLGYMRPRYNPEHMDGQHTLVTRAANMAARKGILVVNSAGNSGNRNWKYIIAPSDGDSVLSIGGIDPYIDAKTGFSSFGPTADNRSKPNLMAIGKVITATDGNKLTKSSGTSFSAPLITGFAACAWETEPDLSNMQLFKMLEASGHLYPYNDYAHGFGIPQASFFLNTPIDYKKKSFEIEIIEDSVKVILNPEFFKKNEKNKEVAISYMNFYYHIANEENHIRKYGVLVAEQKNVFSIPATYFNHGDRLRIHFEGWTEDMEF